jgi:hypothetical protein
LKATLLLLVVAACGENLTPPALDAPVLPACVPNRDGMITADELPIALGATAAYYASPANTPRQVDLAGDPTGWRLDTEHPDDIVIGLGPVELAAQWYAAQFPNGRFVVDAGGGLDAIYHQDDAALWLDGTASQADGANKTLIVYPTPLPVLRFPVIDGEAFTSTVAFTGTIDGLPFNGSDELDVDVTGTGRLDVPYVQFSPALRVRETAVRKTGTASITKRTTIFLFECFGEVARAESKQDETTADFTTAAYLRRFALGVTP